MKYPNDRGRPRFGQLDSDYGAELVARGDEPGAIFVVIMSKFADEAVGEGDITSRIEHFRETLSFDPMTIFDEVGAAPIYEAMVLAQLEGETVGGGWDRVRVVRFPSRLAVTTFLRSDGFADALRHAEKTTERAFNIYALPRPLASTNGTGAAPIHLLEVVRRDIPEAGQSAVAGRADATPLVSFDAEGTLVGDGRRWDEIHLTGFGSVDAAMHAHAERDLSRTATVVDSYSLALSPLDDRLVAGVREA